MRPVVRLLFYAVAVACFCAQLSAQPPFASAAGPATLICDHTRISTGLGDRLLDLIGICAYARLSAADAPGGAGEPAGADSGDAPTGGRLISLWYNDKKRAPTFSIGIRTRLYDTSILETPAGCTLTPRPRFPKWTAGGLIGPRCTENIQLSSFNSSCGRFAPPRVAALLRSRHPGAARLYSTELVAATMASVAAEIRIAAKYAPLLRAEVLRNATCVHLRRGDKVNETLAVKDPPCYITAAHWEEVRARAMAESRRLVSNGEREFYVLSDEEGIERAFAEEIESAGAVLLNDQLPDPPDTPVGLPSAVELFRLAACRRVGQNRRVFCAHHSEARLYTFFGLPHTSRPACHDASPLCVAACALLSAGGSSRFRSTLRSPQPLRSSVTQRWWCCGATTRRAEECRRRSASATTRSGCR